MATTRTATPRLVSRVQSRAPGALNRTRRVYQYQTTRNFYSSPKYRQESNEYKEPFGKRLRRALNQTKIKWYPIPVGLGIGFLGFAQSLRVNERERVKRQEEEWSDDGYLKSSAAGGPSGGNGNEGRPKRRDRIRPTGPWQVQVMSTLPLKAISRIWGKFNELQIPYYLRVPGFKLYSFIFGVNLSEVSEPDLHVYPNLASFFYRTLKPGARPLDPNQNALLSPSDGRVLQFGTILNGDVEQVKGMTYSVDALLGTSKPGSSPNPSNPSRIFASNKDGPQQSTASHREGESDVIKQDEEFARVNGISYTLPNLFSGSLGQKNERTSDASTTSTAASEAEVRADLALGERPWYARLTRENRTALYYVVVYLAPGDYHRFHSPTAWVVEKRRHFAGELYSVSPYLQRTLPGLFTLNERVVLLGRWRWGFFSYTPVGATNVGSIKINFDRELRTNSLTTDTAADRAAEAAAKRGEPYSGFAEATYDGASPILHGHALKRGEEMGGFQLGSTVVLVFEAPKGQRPSLDEGWMGEKTKIKGGWNWNVEKGQKVKMGQALGWVDE